MEEASQTQKQKSHRFILEVAMFLILPAIIGVGVMFFKERSQQGPAPQNVVGNQDPVPALTPNPPAIPNFDPRVKERKSETELTKAEFDSEREYYLHLVTSEDPGEALEELRVNVERDVALLRSCHAMTHEIGRFSYLKYQDFDKAMRYLDEICNTGYMHGLIEELFFDSRDIVKEVETICQKNNDGRCYHGVGHGLMFNTNNNLPEALKLCQTYTQVSYQQYCAEGVYMENFNLDQKDHKSEFLKDDDLFYPCSVQQDKFKDVCYYYAPIHFLGLNKAKYEEALDWCNSAELAFVLKCVRGVAAMLIKENISRPKYVEEMCMTAERGQIAYCIDGMIGLYINHYDSPQKGYELCENLLASNQRACTAGVKTREGNFTQNKDRPGEVKGIYTPLEN